MTFRLGLATRLAVLFSLPTILGGCPASVAEHDRPCPSKTLFEDVVLDGSSAPGQLGVLEGVTEVVGDVDLEGYQGDLGPMSCLEKVHGALRLGGDSLDSLRGLDRLRETGGLSIFAAPNLSSLVGLERIETTGPLTLERLPRLSSTAALESLESLDGELWLAELPATEDLSGFTGVTGVRDRIYIRDVNDADALELDLGDEFAGEIVVDIRSPDLRAATSSLVRVDGTLNSGGGTVVQLELSQLEHVGGGLLLSSVDPVVLPDLSSLRSVSGALVLSGFEMTDLTSLGQLETVGALQINDCDALQTLTALENLRSLLRDPQADGNGAASGALDIYNNEVLTDVSALAGLTDFGEAGPSFLFVVNNPSLRSLSGLGPAASQMISTTLESLPALTDLTGLADLTGLGGLTVIETGLRTLDGLSFVPGADRGSDYRIELADNTELEDISALVPAPNDVFPGDGYLLINEHPKLSRCHAEELVNATRNAGFDGTVELMGLLEDGPC